MKGDLGQRFERMLIEDVIATADRRQIEDTQANRRDWVRAVFAAIEGFVWQARERVLEVGNATGELSQLAAMALRESSYQVDQTGRLHEQVRYIGLPTMIKLIVRQAKAIQPGLVVDLNGSGWLRFNEAIVVRNRVTHPKSRNDLHIGDTDAAIINDALSWFLAASLEIMIGLHVAHVAFNRDARELLDQLRSGDPAALALYHAELNRDPDG